ncbi:MAG: hypothetical protein UY31_C0032G0010 [Candidatus Wolfebacteria bacterium GW2011_GWE1_48_7]|uniref:Uncharacterized protein n=2 Tax=Candidatus Wolfeibacteriota TaxID=1752735 RepID=A0A0G1U7Q9_9BACT|nr:MAG: hypothetical protein UX70_C0001G0719 [Candidatus Wolfebacteria bacterium GW2011_GWB1_47_1]KKU36677.1 MAG: hypothetical protein UX49_C0011G0015 [Candidatus Wolfebacteria bacterium GW2011_GWC2_46_275]KKU42359.1 MAG: hypothetical protein UX58_C0002G0073 [Candidatus Wolfebacteria bacterium GW2011_GWB2_46_69]KKU54325.1 MAG: hypothetical protein UX76_C0003G0021 [Candidatus Wolfebacteria bacterium GW2011_GWC1_47_103]KKU59550.1 MAG: hypothetical protein UX83_C0004G0052 [Candidatus Wolfebacteria
MKCSHNRYTGVGDLRSNLLDPRRILSLVVQGKGVHTQTLDLPARIAEKMSMPIPAMEIMPAVPVTKIISIQMKNRLVVLEVDGPLNETVKAVASLITEQMSALNMVTAFFPGSASEKTPVMSQYYFGFGTAKLRAANPNISNIRLLNDGQGVLFTQVGQLKRIPLSQLNENWVEGADIMHEFGKPVTFLGRVQDKKIAVTLSDSTTVIATLTRSKATVTGRFAFGQRIGTLLGEINHAGGALYAAIRGRELTLTPVATGE